MKHFPIFMLLAAFLTGACTNSLVEDDSSTKNDVSLPDITASCGEDLTRTYVEDNKYLHWHAGDMISFFNCNIINSQYKFLGQTGDREGSFSAVSSGGMTPAETLSARYAIYPYQSDITLSYDGTISLKLPSTQKYAENSFGKGANTMIAVTEKSNDTFLSFKNACGYLKLKLYGNDITVEYIVIKGNNKEKIAGEATATMGYGQAPVVTMSSNATQSVIIDCEDGVTLGTTPETATEFWVALPEVTFELGITIELYGLNGFEYEKSSSKRISITRNEIQPMAVLEVKELIGIPEDDEIWYTSTNEAVVNPKAEAEFGANIISNTYVCEKGVISFDAKVTKISMDAFRYCATLSTISFPETVLSIEDYAFYDCEALTEINIPAYVETIGAYAFAECTSLSSVYCMAETPPSGESTMFSNSTGNLKIYVPAGSLEAYKAASGWSEYKDYIFELSN